MKANELFVGAWVRVTCARNVPPNDIMSMLPKTGRVVGVDVDAVYVDFVDFGFMLDDIEPIPITPEILEKNGFKLSPCSCNDYNQITIEVRYGNYERCEYEGILRIPKDWKIILFVHRFQHALRLCGIDKEIIL